jgi:HEAT repeat protein
VRVWRERFISPRGRDARRSRQKGIEQPERAFSPPATAEEAQRVIVHLIGDWELRLRSALLGTPADGHAPDAVLVRERAVQGLASLGPVALEPLFRLLRAEHGTLSDFRRAALAALALGRMGDVRALPALLEALRDGRAGYAPVRAAVAGILGQFKAESAATIYRRTLQNQSSDDWQVDAELLGTVRLETIVEALAAALGDSSGEVRAAAAGACIDLCLEDKPQASFPHTARARSALAQADEPQSARVALRAAVEPLVAALGDTEAEVRAQAAMALGWIADPRAAQPLNGCLKDADARCRCAAAEALGMLRTPAALKPLARAMADPSREVRVRAARALGELGDPVAVDLLLAVLRDEEEHLDVRAAAARALGALHLPKALPALQDLLEAPEAVLRAAALDGLAALGFGRGYRLVVPFLWHDPDRAVRHAAARSLAWLAAGREWSARWRLRLALRVSRQARQEALLLMEQASRGR